jgi:hypothetical protein
MCLRFSLRTVIILTALVAAFCAWRSRPSVLAQKFVDAVNAADYTTADMLLPEDGRPFADRYEAITATRRRQSFVDWISGRCVIDVATESITDMHVEPYVYRIDQPPFISTVSGETTSRAHVNVKLDWTIYATAHGLKKPQSRQFPEL